MRWFDWCVVLVFGVWFVLSIANQFKPIGFDPFSIVPRFTFFAPRPGTRDLHLLFRDVFEDGYGPWTELPVLGEWRLSHALWHPRKRQKKALFDCVHGLSRLAGERAKSAVVGKKSALSLLRHFRLTIPYLTLLNVVTSLPRARPAVATQFLILESAGPARAATFCRPLLLSSVHRL